MEILKIWPKNNFAKDPKYDGYQRGLASMVYKYFDKKSPSLAWSEPLAMQDKSTSGSGIKNGNISNNELAEELHKRVIRNFFLFFLKYVHLL